MIDNALREPAVIKRLRVRSSKKIFQDRERTNFLRASEQKTISFLVKIMPAYVTSNILTAIGLLGSIMVFAGFVLANYGSSDYLLLGVVGLAVNWFGDSLDGRIAYYRNTPRKWFGFALDIIMDWVSTVFIGLGYLVYAKGEHELVAFLFVVLYGWAMIISQLRYKITDNYVIDAGLLGPTEIRILIAMVIFVEFLFSGSILYFAILMCTILFIINLVDTNKLLKLGDIRDAEEARLKQKEPFN